MTSQTDRLQDHMCGDYINPESLQNRGKSNTKFNKSEIEHGILHHSSWKALVKPGRGERNVTYTNWITMFTL